MSEKDAKYKVDTKLLSAAISRCLSIISLGERSDTNIVTLIFSKRGLSIEAINSIAEFKTELPVEIITPVKHQEVSIIPEVLLSYTKAYKELNLAPKQDRMVVSSKGFNATIFYVGNPELVERREFKDSENISKVAKTANEVLSLVSGMRNRTDSQALGVIMNWGSNKMGLSIGDTHHAIVVDAEVKIKSSNTLTTTLPNLQNIMSVGGTFAATDDRFYAYSDTDYLAISNKTENMFLADMARSVIESGKRTTKFSVNTDKFKSVIDTLTGAVAETEVLTFNIEDKTCLISSNTNIGNAKASIKIDGFKGKPIKVKVAIHHLKDCLSSMKEKTINISVMQNMFLMESKSKEIKITAALTAIG